VSTPERSAYQAAWRTRRRSGDNSADVLLTALRAHEVDGVWTDPESEVHMWLFDCWQRGVPPSRLSMEATRKMVSALPSIIRPFQELRRILR
jgi:hypothetical protein